MSELNKFFKSETVEILRSKIRPSDYNPRTISKEARLSLKRSIKAYGVVGGMVWNKLSTNLVSGHQKLSILDELNGYDQKTKANDYLLKVEAISVDLKTEKELNIFFNNPSSQGEWDYDKLRELIPDIDYKSAGLTDEDLNIIGIDFEMQTDDEVSIAEHFEQLQAPVEAEREERKAAVKEMKAQIKEKAEDVSKNMESYVMINFDTYQSKEAFMLRFGYNGSEKFIKGEVFSNMVERVE